MSGLDSNASFLPQIDLPGVTHEFARDLRDMMDQGASPHILRQTVAVASKRGVSADDLLQNIEGDRSKLLGEITKRDPPWWVASASVRGANHERRGQLNDDKIYVQEITTPDNDLAIITAVADGHGGDKYVRSAKGAQIAVDAAVTQFRAFADSLPKLQPGANELLRTELCKYLAREWKRVVEDDIKRNPLTESEIAHLSSADQKSIRDNPIIAYGSTLLSHLQTGTYDAYLQLGDGNILDMDTDGTVSDIFPHERLLGIDTISLVSENPQYEMMARVIPSSDEARARHALTMLSTDGLSNSYPDDEGLRKFARDTADNAQKEGLEFVTNELGGWLQETSYGGSGDDITAAIIFQKPNFKV